MVKDTLLAEFHRAGLFLEGEQVDDHDFVGRNAVFRDASLPHARIVDYRDGWLRVLLPHGHVTVHESDVLAVL